MFSELGVFRYPYISHSSVVSGRGLPKKYSQGFLELPRGGQKPGKSKGFFVVVSCLFFPFRLLMVACRLHIPCCLQMCHSSLLSHFYCYVFVLCGGCVFLFLFIFMSVVLFNFHSVVCLCCLLSWCEKNPDQMRKYLTILFSCLCFGACIPTLSLGSINNPTRPGEEPLEMVYFCLASCSFLQCAEIPMFTVFVHINQNFAYKMGPNKNDNVSQSAKHKKRCFRNGLLRKMKTFMFTKTQNLNNEKQR